MAFYESANVRHHFEFSGGDCICKISDGIFFKPVSGFDEAIFSYSQAICKEIKTAFFQPEYVARDDEGKVIGYIFYMPIELQYKSLDECIKSIREIGDKDKIKFAELEKNIYNYFNFSVRVFLKLINVVNFINSRGFFLGGVSSDIIYVSKSSKSIPDVRFSCVERVAEYLYRGKGREHLKSSKNSLIGIQADLSMVAQFICNLLFDKKNWPCEVSLLIPPKVEKYLNNIQDNLNFDQQIDVTELTRNLCSFIGNYDFSETRIPSLKLTATSTVSFKDEQLTATRHYILYGLWSIPIYDETLNKVFWFFYLPKKRGNLDAGLYIQNEKPQKQSDGELLQISVFANEKFIDPNQTYFFIPVDNLKNFTIKKEIQPANEGKKTGIRSLVSGSDYKNLTCFEGSLQCS